MQVCVCVNACEGNLLLQMGWLDDRSRNSHHNICNGDALRQLGCCIEQCGSPLLSEDGHLLSKQRDSPCSGAALSRAHCLAFAQRDAGSSLGTNTQVGPTAVPTELVRANSH